MAQDKVANNYKLLVIGGSAGSIKVIVDALPGIRASLGLAIILILHRRNEPDNNLLVNLLSAKTTLFVKEAEEKELIKPGVIYLAPPGYHLLIENDCTISFDASEKVNFSRPSIDITFESAAYVYGPSLVCMLLSGANADGAEGMKIAQQQHSLAVIQDPLSAQLAIMPQSASNILPVDVVLLPDDIAGFINNLT